MVVTQRARIDFVLYGRNGIYEIHITPILVDEKGTIVGIGTQDTLGGPEGDLTALAKRNGKDEWGNTEIEQTIRSSFRVTQPALPAIPAQPQFTDGAGRVLRPETKEQPAVEEIREPRYAKDTEIIWT